MTAIMTHSRFVVGSLGWSFWAFQVVGADPRHKPRSRERSSFFNFSILISSDYLRDIFGPHRPDVRKETQKTKSKNYRLTHYQTS